jgi:hypothetical protein
VKNKITFDAFLEFWWLASFLKKYLSSKSGQIKKIRVLWNWMMNQIAKFQGFM